MAKRVSIKQKNYKKRASKLIAFKDLQRLSKKLKRQHKKTVFALGSFELLHPGQCRFLAEAKAEGDVLIVGVATDDSERRLKGDVFPLISEDVRAELVSYLKVADYVTIVDSDKPHAALILLQPDVFYTSSNSWEKGVRGVQDRAVIKSYGGKIKIRKIQQPYYSANALINHIADIRVAQILRSYLREKVPGFDFDPETHLKPLDLGTQLPNKKAAFNAANQVVRFEDLTTLGDSLRKQRKTISFVSGSYDLLHVGHCRFIEQASLLADVLVVGIPSDTSLRKLKGIGRPVICEYSRAYTLAHLDPVDYVEVFEGDTILESLEALKPDIFYTVNESWNSNYKESPEYKLVKGYGGKVVCGNRESPNISASAIIDKAALRRVRDIFSECMDEQRYEKILNEKSRLNGK